MAKNIVFCFDGTWKDADKQSKRTNVSKTNYAVRTARALSEETERRTKVKYIRGVGTKPLDRLRGGLLGIGLNKKIEEAYRALGRIYQPGDRLYLFGYSRGAYTARSLAGLIRICGVPRRSKCDSEVIASKAVKIYRIRDANVRAEAGRSFGRTNAHSSVEGPGFRRDVWFVGVWDTVGSLGVPISGLRWIGGLRSRFHDVELGPHICHAYHAVAIHEGRREVAPVSWTV